MLGPHMDLVTYIPQLTPVTAEHAAAFVIKASRVGDAFDHAVDRLRDGVANGRTPPRVAVDKVLGQLDAYLASPVEKDPFLAIQPPAGMSPEDVAEWRADLQHQVEEVVRPALARYRAAIAAEVLPAARPQEKSGICWIPERRRGLPPRRAPLHLAGGRPARHPPDRPRRHRRPGRGVPGVGRQGPGHHRPRRRSTTASATTRRCASRPPPR